VGGDEEAAFDQKPSDLGDCLRLVEVQPALVGGDDLERVIRKWDLLGGRDPEVDLQLLRFGQGPGGLDLLW